MVCVEVSNTFIFVIVYNEVSKEVCMMLVTCLGQAFVHGSIFLSHQGKHNIAECPGLTCSKLLALRAEKKPTLPWSIPGHPEASQGNSEQPGHKSNFPDALYIYMYILY